MARYRFSERKDIMKSQTTYMNIKRIVALTVLLSAVLGLTAWAGTNTCKNMNTDTNTKTNTIIESKTNSNINNTKPSQKTKVACIGDSLTRGYLLADAQSYPAQLQQLLGAQYEVRNFGHTSSYVIDDGPVEYRNTEDYSAAIQYDADILIFMFGANDVGAYNFTPLYFQNQYRELIDSFRQTKKHPKIYLIIAPDSRDLHFGLIQQTIQPVMTLGQQLPATVINPYYLFLGHPEDYLSDGLHLTGTAYGKLAQLVLRAMQGTSTYVEAPVEPISPEVQAENNRLFQQATEYQAAERASKAAALAELRQKYPNYETTGLWIAHGIHI